VGEELEEIIRSIVNGETYKGAKAGIMDLGIPAVPTFRKDTTDRNRTSPFAFTGNKFEFRMLGSSQNIAMPNIVLNTAVAESFKQFADVLEKADDFDAAVAELIKETFTAHMRILFDGNGYSEEWEKEAEARGLLNLKTSVDAYKHFNDPKNVKLFIDHGVMSEVEINSREEIYFENYAKIVNIEALTMIEMASRDIIPAVNAYVAEVADTMAAKLAVMPDIDVSIEKDIVSKLSDLNAKAYRTMQTLKAEESAAAKTEDAVERAEAYCYKVIPVMQQLRAYVDEMEPITASEYWPLPTYGDLMFNV
jgi:glutamine synthetase